MNLYEITAEQKALINKIELLEGEITEEIENALIINENQLQSKSVAYLAVIKNKENFNSLVDEEIKRLQAIKKTNTNLVNRLKDNLLNAINLFGDFQVGTNKFGIRKSSTLEVEDTNSLPEKYKVIKVSETADKMALKSALKNGEEIKGVYLQEHKNLKIN